MTHVEKLKWEKKGWRTCSTVADACAELRLVCRCFGEKCLIKVGECTILAHCSIEHVVMVLPLRFDLDIREPPESLCQRNKSLDRIRWCRTDEGIAVCDFLCVPFIPTALSDAIVRLVSERSAVLRLPEFLQSQP
jgi:hypothetical protein